MPLSTACPKPMPRVIDKKAAKREEASTLRSVYRQVDQRDRSCRCCGSKEQLEHHHMTARSRGGVHSLANVVRLCRSCHRLCQTHWIWIDGKDANQTLRFEMTPQVAERLFAHRTRPPQIRIVELRRD